MDRFGVLVRASGILLLGAIILSCGTLIGSRVSPSDGPAQERAVSVETGYTDADGITLYYETRRITGGRARGYPIVFIHGLTFSSRQWDDQLNAITIATGCEVVSYNQRGHIYSDPVSGP